MSLRRIVGLTLAAALIPLALHAAPKRAPRPKVGVPVALAPLPPILESDWRTPNPDNLLVIDTNKGRIAVEMYPEMAPAHVERIQALARKHFYDGQTFFRVIDDFMDQTGDPQNNGQGGSDLPNLKGEFTFMRDASTPFVLATERGGVEFGYIHAMPISTQSDDLMAMMATGKVAAWGLFCGGTVGMARSGDPDSANSQFYLMRGTSNQLDKRYTAWGRMVMGEEVAKLIKVGEPPEAPQDKMITVRLASDLPQAERPKVQVLDPHSANFREQIVRALDKGGFSVCDLPVPTRSGALVKP